MAGYDGFSKSNNALTAESEGKLPLTRATAAVAELAGVTRKEARAALKAVGPTEWHHTSKHYNKTNYYSVAQAVGFLSCRAARERLAALDLEGRVGVLEGDALWAAIRRASEEAGVSLELCRTIYYETWEDFEEGF